MGSTSTEPLRIRTEPNHSHVCGINRRRLKPCSMAIESFPRMWDQLAIRGRFRRVKRIIPTYVGSTKSLVNRITKTTNHSHVCGINSRNDCLTHSKNESFPRMWDQQLNEIIHNPVTRIIPTYVGSTSAYGWTRRNFANHSHVCGINDTSSVMRNAWAESFPRMWDQPG